MHLVLIGDYSVDREAVVRRLRRGLAGLALVAVGGGQMKAKNGRTIESSWANVQMPDGRQVRIGIDITGRKQAELEQERLLVKVEQSRRLSEALNRINTLLIGAQSVNEAMPRVLVEAVHALGAEAGGLLRRDSDRWIIEHVFGAPERLVGQHLSEEQADLSTLPLRIKKYCSFPISRLITASRRPYSASWACAR